MTKSTTIIINRNRIHIRPCAIFTQASSRFKSKIQIWAKDKVINAKSLISMLNLDLANGDELSIVAEGEDEQEAVKILIDLVNNKFNEDF